MSDHAREIRKIGKRAADDIVEIGRRLTLCKKLAGHGHWIAWLNREFGWNPSTAENFTHVYELSRSDKYGNFPNLTLPMSSLYLLAAPSTPEAARDEVMADAKAGKKLSHADVKKTVAKHKPQPPPKIVQKLPEPPRTVDLEVCEAKQSPVTLQLSILTPRERKPDESPSLVPPTRNAKSPEEILAIAYRVRARTSQSEVVDLCDWVIEVAGRMVAAPAPQAKNDEPQSTECFGQRKSKRG
jgi:hypothetical protein